MSTPPKFETWEAYLKSFPAYSESFTKDCYMTGCIPEDAAQRVREAVTEAQPAQIANEGEWDEIAITRLRPEDLAILNKQHTYRAFDERTDAALSEALKHIAEPVAKALNSPWRVLNVRSWTTPPGATHGPNRWHRDGDNRQILKIMLYSTPVNPDHGGIEFEGKPSIEGPAGTWALFCNSVLKHRAMAPKKAGHMRVATEITVCPATEYDLKPRSLGLIARYPRRP